ncbi:squalene synthase HpnC [Blastococcus saxobsidens]|uniref:Phytoene synthase (Modular protein) n=1 Tax=Blastococcus saxobsidens (strain DD2) TaxID=1146883 RepID=H6RL63_BLASD|nr:squalene synthase HpnC [Blastococcus saxobsidens]CCG01193.1 Phytoene synthase (modular protein) [Blastococcus saxobsidens DD2]
MTAQEAAVPVPAALHGLAERIHARPVRENFPVAPPFLHASRRRSLQALYRFARFVDDVGDEPLDESDRAGGRDGARRTELLQGIRDDLRRLPVGEARLCPVADLAATGRAWPVAPLDALVRANLQDQVVDRYATFDELLAYCRLSAVPVGELVLHVFNAGTPERLALASDVCTALQIVEHCQDVAEDLRRGRIYLPLEDLARFGVTEDDLAAGRAGPQVRRLLACEVDRAEELLDAGAPLVATLPGEARLLTAGFVAGGRAAIRAIRAAGHDVLAAPPRPTRRQITAETIRILLAPRAAAGRPRRIASAYRRCEEITRREARNFSYGIRLLPTGKRRAMSAIYAFARRVDDIGDDTTLTPAEKRRLLSAVRDQLHALDDHRDDPVSVALHDAAVRMQLPLTAFDDLIDGVEMDVEGRAYRTMDDLVDYCEHVAGSIGRLSLGVFGTADPEGAAPLADALGVGLQITNILRDIREDLGNGRVYLPAEDLAAHGIALVPGELSTLTAHADRVPVLVRAEADRARDWYATGLQLIPLLDRRSAACCLAMSGIYRRLLEKIDAAPEQVVHTRVSLPVREKLAVAVQALAGRAP